MYIYLLATLDTKGAEAEYLRDRLQKLGVAVRLMDTGSSLSSIQAEIPSDEVFAAAGLSSAEIEKIRRATGERGAAITAAAAGAARLVKQAYERGELAGVLSLGGSAGTTIACTAMQGLPLGVPKFMVSTLASGQTRPYVGFKDIVMLNPVVDIAGLNRVTRTVLSQAAAAVAGMVKFGGVESVEEKPIVVATMFGVTTPCVQRAREVLEQAGCEVLVFHATGTGGQAMEALIREGVVAGVLDITTTEIADELVGGVLSAGVQRLTAASECNVPQVVSVGALDMVNFGPRATVPESFRARLFHEHNANVTLMRTTAEENAQLGAEIGRKLSAAVGPAAILLPLQGVSAIDREGQPFNDPPVRAALFEAIRAHAEGIEVVELECHINDAAFAEAAANRLLKMLREAETMVGPVVEFSAEESKLLQELGLAVFRNKLILDSQPPISDSQLAHVQQQVSCGLSPELIALWRTSFGGRLDYDFEVQFGEHLYTASFKELFYSGSEHYNTLDGWIEHELEIGQQMAEEQGEAIPERIPFVPFGGFEYLERFYVSLRPNEYGVVLVYARGIPWKGHLNEDSVAKVANSVAELFDQLSLNEDPFDENSDKYASGKEMVERILEIESEHPQLAEKLKQIVRRSVIDWQRIVDQADFARVLSAKESKALRLALAHAVDRSDLALVERLHKAGAPFNVTLYGKGGILDYAMLKQAFDIVQLLMELDVEHGDTPVIYATNCPNDLLQRLIEHGVRFDKEAIFSAAETGAINAAIALTNSSQIVEPTSVSEVIATAKKRAAGFDHDAIKVESGQLGSYLTADDYRKQASLLREFTNRLEKVN